jgi:hypothetical protein
MADRRLQRLGDADLSQGQGIAVESYVKLWAETIEIQAQRLRHRRARVRRLHIDSLQFVHALDQLSRSVEWTKARTDDPDLNSALVGFHAQLPGLRRVRNAIEHFDEWRSGLGDKQQRNANDEWIVSHQVVAVDRSVRIIVRLGHHESDLYRYDVDVAHQAACDLARATQQAIVRHLRPNARR